jgi:soluble lytic murein transglycosylase-like protein
MVDLPRIPRRLETTKAALSDVTAAEIASPYAQMGRALDNLGEGLEAISVQLAEQEAHAATVVTDEQGNPRVEAMPLMLGKAGAAYNRIVHMWAVADGSAKIDEIVTRERQRYAGKPEEFKEWADSYAEELAGKPDDPALGAALKGVVQQKAGAAWRGMVSEVHSATMRRANEAINDQLLTAADEIETIARQGGAGTAEFRHRVETIDTLLSEKVSNPLLGFPKEGADRWRDEVLTRAHGAAILDSTEGTYRSSGYDAARRMLRELVQALGTTVKSADRIERQGLAWLRSEEASYRGERDAIGREWSAAKGQVASLPAATVDDLEQRATAVGAYRVASDIRVNRSALDIVRELRALPLNERAAIATAGTNRSGALADRIVQAESGGNPNAQSATSSATGAGQFISSTWLRLIRGSRPDLAAGKSDAEILALRRNEALSREMVGAYAAENKAVLAGAGAPTDDGALYLAHFLGAGDAAKVLTAPAGTPVAGLVNARSIEANRGIFTRNATSDALTAWAARKVGGVDLTTSREGLMALGMLKQEIGRDLQRRIDDFASADRKMQLPSPEEIVTLGAEVAAIGTPEQRQRVAELAAQAEQGANFKTLPPAKRAEIISAWNARLAEGGPAFERELRDKLVTADKAISDAFVRDPYDADVRFGTGSPVPSIDLTKPDSTAAIVADRLRRQTRIRADRELSAFSVFRPAELDSVRSAMLADPAVAARTMAMMSASLPADVFSATMAGLKDTLDGMVRSYEPVTLSATMGALDKLWRTDPQGFAKDFGDTLKRLQVWQAWKDTSTPAQMAERFKAADDPAAVAIRERRERLADDELKQITPAKVAAALGRSWPVTPGAVARYITGSDPGEPITAAVRNGLQADRLHQEFGALYREFRAVGLEPEAAQKKAADNLGTIWGQTGVIGGAIVGGGVLMRHPPEKYFPKFDGSHDWLRQQAIDTITAIRGPQLTRISEADGGGTAWTLRGVIADAQTEAEIARGAPPSYHFVVSDNINGRVDVLTTADGRTRFTFDRKAVEDASAAKFERRRAIELNRPAVVPGGVTAREILATGGL